MGFRGFGGLLFLVFLGASARADLIYRFQNELRTGNHTAPSEIRAAVSKYRFVFVSGIFNEWHRNYFSANLSSAREEFGAKDAIVLFPDSNREIGANSALLAREFNLLFESGGKRPLFIIAHSKGAAETLAALLTHQELLQTQVAHAVLVQGALGGSPFADFTSWLCEHSIGIKDWPLTCNPGLDSLTTSIAQRNLRQLIEAETGNNAELIREKVRTVRGFHPVKGIAPLLSISARYLESYGANDGMLLLESQKIPGGDDLDLGVIETDHVGLVGAAPVTTTSSTYRRAFTRALLSEILN